MVDDLDLDLDMDSEDDLAPRRKPAAKASAVVSTTPAPAPAAGRGEAADAAAPRKVTVVPAEKVGLLGKILAPGKRLLGRCHLPPWNARNFGLGLLVLVLVVLIAENWPDMRLSFIGLHADVPKAVVLVVDFALGFLIAWLMLRKRRERPDTSEAES